MSNYVKSTDFQAKDSLLTGDPNKIIKGAEINDEFNAIQTAVATKADISSPAFLGNPTAPTQTLGNNSTRLATTAFVFQNSVPQGGIIIWSGSVGAVPTGWLLCDGTNGTPNLRDRFIVGAGSTYSVNSTGGSADAVVVAHTHTGTTDSNGTHSHTAEIGDFEEMGGKIGAGGGTPGLQYSTNTAGAHTHTFTTGTSGVSGTNANLPPYYALAYIMKA
jgi:hypothetical protein